MTQKEQELQRLIQKEVFLTSHKENIVTPRGTSAQWIFDFRRIFLSPEGLGLAADVFWERFAHKYPFQVAGLESAALPLVAAIIMRGIERGYEVNGFFIRKSRNKSGLLNKIEGRITNEEVVLVDDLINTGSTFLRQIEILNEVNLVAKGIFSFVRYRDMQSYSALTEQGLFVESVFTLEDFGKPLEKDPPVPSSPDIFFLHWALRLKNPNYFYVIPKSAPVLDDNRVYFGSDSGDFWAINQQDGSVGWKFHIRGPGTQGKTIFSSPALERGTVFFGAYDGNVYALDALTGKQKWVFSEADWVGSSPCVAIDRGLVYIGLEFGLIGRNGGVAALDVRTGEKRWETRFSGLTHGSPVYSKKFGIVAVGSNDSNIYGLDAKTGKILWVHRTGAEVRGGGAVDEKRGYVVFGSYDGGIHILNIKDGSAVLTYTTGDAIYSTPCIEGDFVYIGSMDKRVYCINLRTRNLVWSSELGARVFASPIVVGGHVYIGTNNGKFYRLDAQSGNERGFFLCTERITNRAAYNNKTKRFFVPTFANELFCLELKSQ